MNITYIISVFPKLSETFILDEVIGQIKYGHNVQVLAFNAANEDSRHEEIDKYNLMSRTYYLKKIKDYPYFLLNDTEVQKILLNTDIILTHFASGAAQMARRLNEMFRIPYILTTHAFDIFINPDKEKIRDLVLNAETCITVSDYNRKYMLHEFGEDLENKIKVVLNAIHLDTFIPVTHKESKNVKILTIGRFTEKKGLINSVRAFSIAVQKNENIEYTIIGDGHLFEDIKEIQKELNLEKNLKLTGALTRQDTLRCFEDCDIFLLASEKAENGDCEGMPVSILEAMALGLPVISTYHTGIPEAVIDGQTGHLVEEGDIEGLAEKIIFLAQNQKERVKMGQEGRKRAVELFDSRKRNEVINTIIKDSLDKFSSEKKNKLLRAERIINYINDKFVKNENKNREENINSEFDKIKKQLLKIKNDKWYRFGKLPRKKKIRKIIKIMSIKLYLYPIYQWVKKCYRRDW